MRGQRLLGRRKDLTDPRPDGLRLTVISDTITTITCERWAALGVLRTGSIKESPRREQLKSLAQNPDRGETVASAGVELQGRLFLFETL